MTPLKPLVIGLSRASESAGFWHNRKNRFFAAGFTTEVVDGGWSSDHVGCENTLHSITLVSIFAIVALVSPREADLVDDRRIYRGTTTPVINTTSNSKFGNRVLVSFSLYLQYMDSTSRNCHSLVQRYSKVLKLQST